MPTVVIPTERGPMPGYLSPPADGRPRPGVVLVHDVVGMSRDLHRQADWLADEGFLAVAPDLFHWGSRGRCLLSSARDYLYRRGRIFDDIEATRRWLGAQTGATGRIGVLGFCFGGGFAVLLAAEESYTASSVNYGLVPRDVDRLLADACPIVGSFGAEDRAFTRSAQRLANLATTPSPHEVTVYQDAGHAFLNDHDPADVPLVLRLGDLFSRSAGTYRPEAAALARQQISAFLHRHLDDPDPVG